MDKLMIVYLIWSVAGAAVSVPYRRFAEHGKALHGHDLLHTQLLAVCVLSWFTVNAFLYLPKEAMTDYFYTKSIVCVLFTVLLLFLLNGRLHSVRLMGIAFFAQIILAPYFGLYLIWRLFLHASTLEQRFPKLDYLKLPEAIPTSEQDSGAASHCRVESFDANGKEW